MGQSKTSPQKIEGTEGQLRAMALRRQGKTYDQIGRAMGVSRQRAYQLVKAAFDRLNKELSETTEEVRSLMGERLERLLRAVWLQATKGDLKAVATALSVFDRQSRLFGLDAPTKSTVRVESMSDEEVLAEARRLGIVKGGEGDGHPGSDGDGGGGGEGPAPAGAE
jgi:hypothetical protein